METVIKQMAAVMMLCFISACGGTESPPPPVDTPDYSSNFTGTWQGNQTTTLNEQSVSTPLLQAVRAVAKNRFVLEDSSCPVYGTATGEVTSFIEPFDNCSSTSNGCTLSLGINVGSFTRDGAGARLAMSGHLTVGSRCAVPAGTYLVTVNTDLLTRTSNGSLVAQEDSEIAPSSLLKRIHSTLRSPPKYFRRYRQTSDP